MALDERSKDFTIASALAHRATIDAAAPFLYSGDSVLSYGAVDNQAEALAASLSNLGIGEGDCIALVLPAWPEFVVSLFAAAKLGAVIVPLNPRLTLSELGYMLRHSGAACAITGEKVYGIDYLALFEDLLVELPELQYLVTVGEEDLWYDDRIFQWEDLISAGHGRDFAAPEALSPDQAFAIVYTSGTSGKPKGVELSHRNLLSAAARTSLAIDMTSEDRVVGVIALFHVFGLGPGILGTLMSGASLVLQDEFGAAETLNLIERHKATVQYGVPTLFATMLREQSKEKRDVSSLRVGLAAGAPMGEELRSAVEERLCSPLLVAYSLTELSSTVALTRKSDKADQRAFTVGRPIEETVVQVVSENGDVLPVESVGEIAVRGPGVMLRYYRQPKETASVVDDGGFLRTGDLGMIDEEGFLHLVGRRKDVVIRGGFNVYPREVEDRLEAHPAVERAAVVGVSHEVLGEALGACIIPVEGAIVSEADLSAWCALTMADYKVPDLVRIFDEFPLTGSGKVWRLELARLVEQG